MVPPVTVKKSPPPLTTMVPDSPLEAQTPFEAKPLSSFDPMVCLALGMENETGLSNSYSVRLFGPNCLSSTSAPKVPESSPRVNLSEDLVHFNPGDNSQKFVAQNLKDFLDQLGFDQVNRLIHRGYYDISPIYDHDTSIQTLKLLINEKPEINSRQKLALEFFMYGASLNQGEADQLFGNQKDLWNSMQQLKLVVADSDQGKISYRLNNLSLSSHRLPNQELLYFFSDLPQRLQTHKDSEPSAQISGTSYILLHRLEKTYREADMDQPMGVVADFGSGTGILSLALLKMYPSIQEALAVEIDPHSINLSVFNSMLNGVEDRFRAVDNHDTKNFTQALAGRPLDMAISNPPFNVVPKGFSEEFTDFGDGGVYGLDVTQIFLAQALPVLKKGGHFIAYSILAQDSSGDFFLSKHLREKAYAGLTLNYEKLNLSELSYSSESYAKALAGYLNHHRPQSHQDPKLSSRFEQQLKDAGIAQLKPYTWVLQAQGDKTPLKISSSDISLPPLESFYGAKSPGGISFTRIQSSPQTKGGVYIQQMIRPPLLEEGLRKFFQLENGQQKDGEKFLEHLKKK
jgi:methylase of polypeptide subunit release factors